ncbi:distal tail protein Dit [Siminovitchia sp. FSL W7-1587]|uniref:distal tail protein Dit n=1 Tax=Siminovitchia sp. FSL W7-1587 TaxID=2954699 RepID=UPI0030CED5A4
MTTINFNGKTDKRLVVLRGKERPAWAPVNREFIRAPGRPGGYPAETQTEERVIRLPVLVQGLTMENLQKIKEELADWLVTDDPAPLIISDEPDRTYYAYVNGSLDLEEVVNWGSGTLEFVCPDPHKYGTEQSAPSDEPGSGRNYIRNSNFPNEDLTSWGIQGGNLFNQEFIRADKNYLHMYSSTADTYRGLQQVFNLNLKAKDVITVSLIAYKRAPDVGGFQIGIHWRKDNQIVSQSWSTIDGKITTMIDDIGVEPSRFEFTYAVPNTTDEVDQINLMLYGSRGKPFDIFVTEIKLELGDTATPWSPAPEDTGILEINNEGSADTFPVVEVKLKKPTPFVSISNGHDINMIGEIPDAEEPVYEKYSNILMDYLKTTVGWAKIKFSPYTGTITDGIISADSQGFFPSSYGYVPGLEWHGPALAKSLPEPVQDLLLHLTSYLRAATPRFPAGLSSVGRQELYALDSVNKPVMSLHFIKDSYGKVVRPEVIVYNSRGEPRKILSLKREQVPDWKDFYGYISILREGRRIVAQAEESAGLFGGVRDRRIQIFQDVKGEYQRPIVSVAIVFQAYRQIPTLNRNRAERAAVDKIVQKPGVPYVATTGDIITFDHPQNVIYKNGIDVKKEKAFIGQYFALKPGENALAIEPADAIETMSVRWRNRWR